MKGKGIVLPPTETEEGLSSKEIMEKIRSFYTRFGKCKSEISEYLEGYFLQLLHSYPKSMCSRHTTETKKLLMALIYSESKPNTEEKKPIWNGFSYEDLALMFDVSKSTVHEALSQKEVEAKQLLEDSRLRTEAKRIALEQLIEEEKQKLRQNQETTEETPEQTNERQNT